MDLTGKTCLVTGATSGIGEATAHSLAAAGARVGILCRNPAKGEETVATIHQATGNESLKLFCADLSSQDQIRRVAKEILEAFDQIHVLVNNAGIVNLEYSETEDGIETVFAVNHLAYFLLTNLLLERIRASAPARIVNVSSNGHKFVGGIDFENPGFRNNYKSMRVYGHSKLANILFTNELARQLEGTGVTANSLHPGAVATNLATNNGFWATALMRFVSLFFNSPERGARTSIHLATSPVVEGTTGKYFASEREAAMAQAAADTDAAKRLWEMSERMTEPKPPEGAPRN